MGCGDVLILVRYWSRVGSVRGAEYRRAKERIITRRELGLVLMHGQRDSARHCRWFPVSSCGNGHARGTYQDYRVHEVCRSAARHEGRKRVFRRVGELASERARGRGWRVNLRWPVQHLGSPVALWHADRVSGEDGLVEDLWRQPRP